MNIKPLIFTVSEYSKKYFETDSNLVFHGDCMELMKKMPKNSVDLLLTDIPYEKVNKSSNGLRKLDKKEANIKTFSTRKFLKKVDQITKGSGYIFCGKEQVSEIFEFFNEREYSTRLMIWEKTNPSPMNCQHVWMSGIECFVYFKKRGAVFNEFYKNSVVRFPNGISKVHPTQKPINLFEYLVEVSSNPGDVVFDPCLGSGTALFASMNTGRKFIGCELNKKFCTHILLKCNTSVKKIKFKDSKEKKHAKV